MSKRGRLRILFITAVLNACTVYRPIEQPVPKEGSKVAADLTDAGSAGMARWVGPGVTEIRGQVVTASEEALLVSVRVVQNRSGTETTWKGEQVDIPQNWISSLRREEFSWTRTGLVGVLVAGAVYLGITIAGEISPSNPPPNPGGPNPN
jgi:hypothetical protein